MSIPQSSIRCSITEVPRGFGFHQLFGDRDALLLVFVKPEGLL